MWWRGGSVGLGGEGPGFVRALAGLSDSSRMWWSRSAISLVVTGGSVMAGTPEAAGVLRCLLWRVVWVCSERDVGRVWGRLLRGRGGWVWSGVEEDREASQVFTEPVDVVGVVAHEM